ncbi:MAG: hypothetical protein HY812_21990 [Planctomycetes bacterium]|nr:hypothetical protein [Planctomycetota bacterium]
MLNRSPSNSNDSNGLAAGAAASWSVALAYVGAALATLAFLKGLALFLAIEAFGAVAAGVTLLLAVTFVAMALQAKNAAEAVAGGGRCVDLRARASFDALAVKVGASASLLSLLLRFLPFSAWFDLPSPWLAAMAPLLAGSGLLFGHATGALLGAGEDRAFAVLIVLDPILRCLLAAVCATLGLGAEGLGPLVSILCASAATTALARAWLPAEAQEASEDAPRRRRARTPLAAPPALAALASFGLLVFLDAALVRLVLTPLEAARFAAIAVASRFLVLLPFPLALLTMAAARGRMRRREAPLPELLSKLALAFCALGLCVLLINELGGWVLGFVLDDAKYGGLERLYARYALAAAVYGLTEMVLLFGIALGRVSLALLPPVVLVIECTLLIERGKSAADCVSVVQAMAFLHLAIQAVVVLLPLLWSRRR